MKETKLSVVISEDTFQLIADYLNEIKQNPTIMGNRLRKVFENTTDIEQLTTADLIDALLKTKKPQIFPENLEYGLLGNGSDWTKQEAQLLGRIGLQIEVKAYSKQTYNPNQEDKLQSPHPVTVLVTNGALLKGNATGECQDGCDQEEVCENGYLNKEKLKKYFEARLLPLLLQANQDAGTQGGLVTIPGLGAGAFAGGKKFPDGRHITSQLGNIYREIIAENKDRLKNIKGIIYDKFDLPVSEPIVIPDSNIKFIEEACSNDNGKQRIGPGQLALPEEHDKDFKECKVYTVVAGDHVAFPGNDMYINSCRTHEGGVGARTNLLGVITGIEGEYIEQKAKFLPTEDPEKRWDYYCKTNEVCLGVETVTIALENGTIKKEPYQHSSGYKPAYLDAYKTTYDSIPVTTAFTNAIAATPIAADVVKNTEEERRAEKEKTRKQLGFNNETQKYEPNKQEKQQQYKQQIQQSCHFSVNFGLNYEGGEEFTNLAEIKDYPLWKVMKKIERDAPESTLEQQKQKHIAIASIRALIYLKLNKKYAAELAYIYSIEREFINSQISMKDSAFHQFRLDANNPKDVSHLEKDLLIWRTPAYNPLNTYGIHPNLANHLEYYLRFNNYQNGEPWTKKEVLAKLEEDLVAQETLISTIIDPNLTPQKQDDLLKNFVSKVQTGHTGCAAERLQGALTSLAEGKFSVSKKIDKLFTEDSFKELNDYLAKIDEDPHHQYDPKKIADIYMNLFIQLDGQKILFGTAPDQEEIEVSPNNYQNIINKTRSYLIDVACIIDEDTAKNFYELPDGFWLLNSQNIPNFILPQDGSNIGSLEFDDQKTAERSLVFLKHFFAKHTNDKVFTNHAKIQNKEGKFVISISEFQYATFLSYKDRLTTAMQTAELTAESDGEFAKHQDLVEPKPAPTPVPATTTAPLSVPAVSAPVSAKVYNKTKLENFASKILAIDSEDPSYKCILVNIREPDSILVVNPDNSISLSLFNKTLFDRLSAEKKGSDEIISQLKGLETSSISLSECISQVDNKYILNGTAPDAYRKGIQYLCDQLNGDLPPPSLDVMIQNYFFPNNAPKPEPNNQYFNQNIGMIIGQLAHQNEQTVKDPLSNIPIKPIQHHGQTISGANILAIYLQACRNAEIDLFNEPFNLAYLDELLEEIPDSNAKASAKQKYLAQFEELSTGNHLKDFISGKLQLSETEKAFLAQIDIIPSPTKLATPPKTNPPPTTKLPSETPMNVLIAQTSISSDLLAEYNDNDDHLSQLIEDLNFNNLNGFDIMALYEIENFFVLSSNKEKHLQNLYKKINRNIIKNIINSTDENAEDILRILVRLSGTSKKDEVYLLLHRMLFNNEFDETQKATIVNWFPGIVDSNTEQFEIIKVPDDSQELRSLQVRYITNLLSRAIIPNIPADGFNEYIQIPNSKTIVRCSGDIVVAPNLAAKHIASNFWKALFDYFNDNQKFPDKIRIINRVNFGNNHWTSVITEIELDPAKIKKILDALEIAKQECIQQNSNLSADKLEQIYNFLNGSPVDPCVLPTKDIQIRHYDSMNPHGGTSATHDALTESLAKLQEDNQDAKFNLTAKPCIQQTGLQCGDWTALNGFIAGILEQDPAKIDPKKIGNLRSISKRCIDLEQRIQRGEPITQEQIEEVFRVINQSFPKFSSPLTTQLPQNTAIQQKGSSKVVPDTASKLKRLSEDFCDLEGKFQSEKQHDSLSEIKLPEPINHQQLQEHFEDFDLTKHGLKYQSKTTSDFKKTGILGEIITTRQINNNDQVIPPDTTLAAFRPSSVECQIMQNSTNNNGKVLLGEQQQILLDFLQLYSKQAIEEKSSSPIVIEADNFNPEDLQVLLETLINKPIPLISLALPPKPKNVNQQPYTAQDINKINQLITQYHAKQSTSFKPKKPSKKPH